MCKLLRFFTLSLTICVTHLTNAVQVEDINSPVSAVHTYTLPLHPNAEVLDDEDYFFVNLVKLALDKTRLTDGDYQLQQAKLWLADNRLKAALKSGHIDLLWSATTEESEKEFLAVKFPLLKDVGDYRVFIIRSNEQARFDAVQTLDDLRQLTGGVGSQWVDRDVMRANRLPVVASIGYGRLFRMLSAGRFDYFSRGLYQIKREIDYYPELQLVMEEGLMLHYPSPYYFFVRRDNRSLADRLERGLAIAQADGSFDRLFYSIPRHQWARNELLKRNRRVLTLEKPPSSQ